jgi:pimeloyl-ACP methyl ester carboxylesterase
MQPIIFKLFTFLFGLILVLSSCSPSSAQPTTTSIPPTPTNTPLPPTAIPPTPTAMSNPAQPDLVIKANSIAGMVDIGGRRLYIICFGVGSPSVIFESAWGGDWSDFNRALTSVSKYTRACAYDRAGLGMSDPITSTPRTSRDMVEDLHALLANAPIPGPYILVGHSLGGFNIRLYATKYPEEVVGLVSVEGVPVDQFLTCVLPTETPGEDPSFTKAREDCQSSKAWFLDWTDNPEFLDYFASEDQVRATGSFGDLPLVVLAAETQTSGKPGTAEEFAGAIWDRLEREIAALSSNSQYKVIKYSNHGNIVEKQETIDTIIEMVKTLQGK